MHRGYHNIYTISYVYVISSSTHKTQCNVRPALLQRVRGKTDRNATWWLLCTLRAQTCNIWCVIHVQDVPQQNIHSLTTCSWDRVKSKSSNERWSDLQCFVGKNNENEHAITFVIFILFPFNSRSYYYCDVFTPCINRRGTEVCKHSTQQ
jgi:hypothetical protein